MLSIGDAAEEIELCMSAESSHEAKTVLKAFPDLELWEMESMSCSSLATSLGFVWGKV